MTVQDTEKQNIKRKSSFRLLIYGVIIVFFIFVVIASLDGNGRNNTYQVQNQSEAFDDLDAYIQGQYYIKQILKSPATAKFPPTDFLVHRLNDSRFEVVSYVDSQNSFGAMLRSSWNVVFQYQNQNGKTFLEKMIFDGKVVYPIEQSDAYK